MYVFVQEDRSPQQGSDLLLWGGRKPSDRKRKKGKGRRKGAREHRKSLETGILTPTLILHDELSEELIKRLDRADFRCWSVVKYINKSAGQTETNFSPFFLMWVNVENLVFGSSVGSSQASWTQVQIIRHLICGEVNFIDPVVHSWLRLLLIYVMETFVLD